MITWDSTENRGAQSGQGGISTLSYSNSLGWVPSVMIEAIMMLKSTTGQQEFYFPTMLHVFYYPQYEVRGRKKQLFSPDQSSMKESTPSVHAISQWLQK